MSRNYILSEDPKFDVVKLRPVKPGDEYYLLNKSTGALTKIGPQEVQHLFAHSIDDLKKIIDDVIRKNILLDYSDYVDYLINTRIQGIIDSVVASKQLISYKGNCVDLPSNASVGSCYCSNGKYFLRLPDLSWVQIITYENLEEILLKYYTKEELNHKIHELTAEIASLSSYIRERSDELELSLSSYITKEEALAKLSEYETKVGEYRETYEQQMDRLQTSWNEEISNLRTWRNAEQQRIDTIDQRWIDLQAQHESQVQQISTFIEEKTEEINSCNVQISGLLNDFTTLKIVTSGILQDLTKYDEIYRTMRAQIEQLSAKLTELQQFDQSILEL